MNRPFPLPSDIEAKQLRPSAYVVRAASASLKSFLTGATPVSIARSMWDDDRVTPLVLRAATGPALTTQSGWAQQLAGVAVIDLIQSITSLSAGAEIISRGLQVSMDGLAQATIPARSLNASDAGQWVGEGMAIPVRSLSFANAATLVPRKLAVISTYTREMAESSNIENIVRATLGEDTALALDAAMFSANAADATKPAGVFNNIPPLTATPGGGTTPAEAAATDIGNLFGALASHHAGKTAVIVAAMAQAVRLKMILGPQWDIDILGSTQIAAGTVAAIEVGSFVSGFGSTVEFNVSKVAAVHMESATPTDITGGTPSPAVPVKSLFQIDALALKSQLWATWGMRAANHVAWLQNATW